MKRFLLGLLAAGALAAASLGSAAAAPIYCPNGQTAEKTSDGWSCTSSSGNTSGAGWHNGTDQKIH